MRANGPLHACSHDSPATGVRSAELYVLHPGARREVAPTPLTRRLCEEAAPIALPAPGALSALVTVRHLNLAPVVQSNQATPVFRHDAFLPWFEDGPLPWFEDGPYERRRPDGRVPSAAYSEVLGAQTAGRLRQSKRDLLRH